MRFFVLVCVIGLTSCHYKASNLPAPVAVKMPKPSTQELDKHIDLIEKNVSQASFRAERIKILLDNLYDK